MRRVCTHACPDAAPADEGAASRISMAERVGTDGRWSRGREGLAAAQADGRRSYGGARSVVRATTARPRPAPTEAWPVELKPHVQHSAATPPRPWNVGPVRRAHPPGAARQPPPRGPAGDHGHAPHQVSCSVPDAWRPGARAKHAPCGGAVPAYVIRTPLSAAQLRHVLALTVPSFSTLRTSTRHLPSPAEHAGSHAGTESLSTAVPRPRPAGGEHPSRVRRRRDGSPSARTVRRLCAPWQNVADGC
jgi:hypothetical protein